MGTHRVDVSEGESLKRLLQRFVVEAVRRAVVANRHGDTKHVDLEVEYRRLVEVVHAEDHLPPPIPPGPEVGKVLIARGPRPRAHGRHGRLAVLVCGVAERDQVVEVDAPALIPAPVTGSEVLPEEYCRGAVKDVEVGRLDLVHFAQDRLVIDSLIVLFECVLYVRAPLVGLGHPNPPTVLVELVRDHVGGEDDLTLLLGGGEEGRDGVVLILPARR